MLNFTVNTEDECCPNVTPLYVALTMKDIAPAVAQLTAEQQDELLTCIRRLCD